jgi:hypothetical protein
MDSDAMPEPAKPEAAVAADAENNILDFELAPDNAAGGGVGGAGLAFNGIDITNGQSDAESALDFNIDTGSNTGAETLVPAVDMDSTMQIPIKRRPALDKER